MKQSEVNRLFNSILIDNLNKRNSKGYRGQNTGLAINDTIKSLLSSVSEIKIRRAMIHFGYDVKKVDSIVLSIHFNK